MIQKKENCVIWKEMDYIEPNTQCAMPWGLRGIVLKNGTLAYVISGNESVTVNKRSIFEKKKKDHYELYCVDTDAFLHIRFGTSINPVEYIDDEYGVTIRVRTFGETDCRIENPEVFFKKFIVEKKETTLNEDYVNEYLNKEFSILFTQILRECIEKEEKKTRSHFDNTNFMEKVKGMLQTTFNDRFNKEYGIYVKKINTNDISFSGYEAIEQIRKKETEKKVQEAENKFLEEQMKTIDILKRKKI